ncbi:MAG: hypothetical protein Q9M26_07945 [Mariprofundales bacterium]|nr:hypothetical protein [Mariprofundales bacterium]
MTTIPSPSSEGRTMPSALQFVLTNKLPCALLAFTLFSAMLWVPMLFASVPLLAIVVSLLAVLAHFATPLLFGLIQLGGGLAFLVPVALIASVGVAAISHVNILLIALFLLLYAGIPAWAVNSLRQQGGVARSGEHLAVVLFVAVMVGLSVGAARMDGTLQQYTAALLQPIFDSIVQQQGVISSGTSGTAVKTMQEMRHLLSLVVPGMVVLGLWSLWWSSVLGARWVAVRYNFYHHDSNLSWLHVRFNPRYALLMLVTLLPANLASGNVQFVALSLALLLAGMFAVQGTAIAHLWLKVRGMQLLLSVMYIALFFWSVLVIPFIIFGLLDTWFDFRRNTIPEDGDR